MTDRSPARDKDSSADALDYPFENTPEAGEIVEVAGGIYWLRMPLPLGLNHVNLWLLDDGDGVTIIDTGLQMPQAKEIWERVFKGHIKERPVRKIIVTHYHPDHVGLAGWLHAKTGAAIHMSRTEYLMTRVLCLDVREEPPAEMTAFYKAAGWDEAMLSAQRKMGFGMFAKAVAPLPASFVRLQHGDSVSIDEDHWEVSVGSGHSPEHVCLYSRSRDILIAGDQVLPRISSNVSVYPSEPDADPLRGWLASLHAFKQLPESCLVLPSHNEPFFGLHARLDNLISGHCAKLERLTRKLETPKTTVESLDTLFGRTFEDPMTLSMATGEAVAHLRFLETCGLIEKHLEDGVARYARTQAPAMTRKNLIKFSQSLG